MEMPNDAYTQTSIIKHKDKLAKWELRKLEVISSYINQNQNNL